MVNPLRKLFSPLKPTVYARRWPRILMNEPARMTLPDGEVLQATLMQVCAGGARVQIHERLRPGERVGLEFNLSAGAHLTVNAVVIFALKDSKGFHWIYGLSFLDTNAIGDKRIAVFVEAEQHRRKFGFAMPLN